MAFTVLEKMFLARIVKETYATVSAQITALAFVADQESDIRDRMDVYEEVQDSHVKLSGGSDGVDFDNERKREAIRQELRKALGLSLVSYEVSGVSRSIAHTVVW